MTSHRVNRVTPRERVTRALRYWVPPALVGIAWALLAWAVEPGPVATILMIAAAPVTWIVGNFLSHAENREALARLAALLWTARREIGWQLVHGWRR